MRNCLKLSTVAWTKRSSLIKTPIVCVPQTESSGNSKKVMFSDGEKHLFSYPVDISAFREVIWCLTLLKLLCYTTDSQKNLPRPRAQKREVYTISVKHRLGIKDN